MLPGGGEFATGIAMDRYAGDSAGAGREDEPARVRSDPPVNGSRARPYSLKIRNLSPINKVPMIAVHLHCGAP